jgi:hypothetical protein
MVAGEGSRPASAKERVHNAGTEEINDAPFQLTALDPMLACLLDGVNGFSDARIIAIAGPTPR